MSPLCFQQPWTRPHGPQLNKTVVLAPGLARLAYTLLSFAAITLLVLFFPVSFAIATFRYRLWEIDLLINRALVYGTLTGSLLAVYLGSVVLLQSLFRSLAGQESNLAIVVATLAAAALFQPLRRHLQTFIDRRFYRRKYDAAQVLAAFSVTLRDEVDLARLSDDLLLVVQETLQPAHVSLWLRRPATSRASPQPVVEGQPEGKQAARTDGR